MADSTKYPFILSGKYFKVVEAPQGVSVNASCVTCSQKFKGQLNSTSNFLTHLKRKHPDLVESYEKDKIDDGKRRKDDIVKPSGTIARHFSSDPSRTLTRYEKLLIDFVVKGMHPYSIVEQDSFKAYVAGLNPDATIMTRKTLTKKIQDRFQQMKQETIVRIRNADTVCITADIWTEKGMQRSFMGLTCHWITPQLKRESVALAVRRFFGKHSYDKIAELLCDILEEYKIPTNKVIKAVTDNATNFLKAFREYAVVEEEGREPDSHDEDEEDFENTEFKDLSQFGSAVSSSQAIQLPPHQSCASHSFNLICSADLPKSKDISKFQKSAFAKCQAIWNKSSKSSQKAEAVKKICGVTLQKPVPTRWNTFHDSLDCLMKFKEKLDEICAAVGLPKGFKTEEIEFMEEYLLCLKPIALALDRLQGEENTFYGDLVPTIIQTKKKLQSLQNGNLKHCATFPSKLIEFVDKRFGLYINFSEDHQDAIIASISHPFFKLRWIEPSERDRLKEVFIQTVISNMPKINGSETSSQENAIKLSVPVSNDFFEFQNFADTPVNNSIDQVRQECLLFLSSSRDDLQVLFEFPNVKNVFVKYSTPLPSSAPVERLFNYSGMILSPKRRSLSDSNFEMSTLLKVNKY